ncbi:hypothetical protein F5Y15DRAFT_235938 [Xylariaceae sp. FL0016]|nr:hypothetical protein F5Y15DRAFT_235938 [Xylariaceae sp. FL0016]
MRSSVLLQTLASLAGASPLVARQDIDFNLVNAAPDPSTAAIPVGPTAGSATYDLAAATQAATATPLPVEPAGKRDVLEARSACQPMPTGSGPSITPDTDQAFLGSSDLSTTATGATTPSGYNRTFTNLQASNTAYGFIGFTTLSSYDTVRAGNLCNFMSGCLGFNIFFERDPTLEPGPGCPNPPSTTIIRCVFWGGYVGPENANNFGQYQSDFHVVIAGSNGYMKTGTPTVPGFIGVSLGEATINAPLDCNGHDTYMGAKIFTTSYFDANLCAAACTSQNDYNTAHPPAGGKPELCKFFTTYLMIQNGSPQGQYCALYTQYWGPSYATNDGQWNGDDHYTIQYSFSYVDGDNNGLPNCPA